MAVLLDAALLSASQQSGSVRSAGQPVPWATVTATQGGKTLATATDESGNYVFDNLPAGIWRIRVEIFGFVQQERTITVGPQAAALSWTLELRPRTSTGPSRLRVARQMPPGSGRQSARNPDFLALALNPDANATEASSPEAPPPGSEELGGAESYLVTGSTSSGLEDARRQELRDARLLGGLGGFGMGMGTDNGFGLPQTPGLNPDGAPNGGRGPGMGSGMGGGGGRGGRFGGGGGGPGGGRGGFGGRRRMAGNSRTNIGNRRRRSEIRGSLFFSLRNSALDAKAFSISGQEEAKPSYAQSRFGFSAGGALRIPKLLESKSTFFFVNYTGNRSRNPYNAVATLPSPLERTGDFSQSMERGPVTIYDPLSGLPFPNNQIPKARINPASTGLLPYIPLPTSTALLQNYQYLGSVASTNDNFAVRLNQTLSRRDSLNFNVNVQRRDSQSLQAFGFRDTGSGTGLSSSAGYTHNFGARTINNLRWNFSRNENQTTPYFAGKQNIAEQLGIGGTASDPRDWGPPNLSFTNFGGLTDATPSVNRSQTSTVSDGVTMVRGRQTLTFGGDYRRMQINTWAETGRGSFSFSGIETSAFGPNGQPLPGTGFDFADFLLGYPQSSSIRFGAANTYFRAQETSAYVSDDWRVKPNFSVVLGLRYEYFSPFTEKYGRISNLDIAPGFTGAAPVLPGQAGPYTGRFPDSLVEPDHKLFSPRLGLAWRPLGNRNLIVRAGYGLFFTGSIYSQFPSRLAAQPPFATVASVSTSPERVLTLQDGFAVAPNQDVTNSYALDKNYRVPYVQTWNFSVQQTLSHGILLQAGYMGTKGTRLDVQMMPNLAGPGSPLTAEERRLISNATNFTYDTSVGNSIYHALDLRVQRRFQRGISVNASYVFSKAIDNASSLGGGVVQDAFDLRAERGLSSFDQRHTLNVGYYLLSPVGERGLMRASRWGSRLLSNWSLSGNLSFATGLPMTARILGNLSNTGGNIGGTRADATGASINSGTGFFNLLAFAPPQPGEFGDAARDTIPGPSQVSLNLAFGRSFTLRGDTRRRVEARIETTNLTNHVSYTSVGTVVNSSTYGLPLAAAGMRTMTAVVRFRF